MLTVFGMSLSGNCHKVRITLEHLGISYNWRETDILSGATRTPEFLERSPFGKVPVVQLDDGRFLAESNAIIHYLANGTDLWPDQRYAQAEVLKWMFFEQNRHEPSVAEARFIKCFLPANDPRQAELPGKHEAGHAAFAVMEQQLQAHSFLASGRCTIADIALFAYTHVAKEGGFDMSGYGAIRAWIERLLTLPGFSRMQA